MNPLSLRRLWLCATRTAIFCAGLMLLPTATAQASITWGSATSLAGDTDVSLSGTLEWAYNLGTDDNDTINGVVFDGESTLTGNADVTFAGFNNSASVAFFSGTNPWFALSAEYRSTMEGAFFTSPAASDAPAVTVTLNNLTPGQRYQVQLWVGDPRSFANTRIRDLDVDGSSVVLKYNATETEGGVGQFAIGAFTADGSTTESFVIDGINSPGSNATQLNAIQLRAIPEPTTAAAFAVVGLTLAARRRRA